MNLLKAENILKIWDKINDTIGRTPIHPQYFIFKAQKSVVNITLNKIKSKVLDVGCGRQLLRKRIEDMGITYVSVDHPKIYKRQRGLVKPDILADILNLPIKDNSYESVLLLMVLAHLPKPQESIKEIARVMKKDGLLFVSSIENYPAHDLPDDFFRYRISGLEALCKNAGLNVIEKYSSGNFCEVSATNFNMFILQTAKHVLDKTNNYVITCLMLVLTYPFMLIANILAIILTPIDFINTSRLINFVIVKK